MDHVWNACGGIKAVGFEFSAIRMKNKLNKLTATAALTLSLLMTGVGLAAPAQANSIGHPDYYRIYCANGTKVYYTWKDYNWFEEFFYLKKDGYVVYYIALYRC